MFIKTYLSVRKITALAIFLTLFCFPSYSLASLFIDSIYTTDKGHWDIEFSADYYRDVEKGFDLESGENIKPASREVDASVYFSYGLLDNMDIGLTLPYLFINSSDGKVNGFSDIIVETKYRLRQESRILPGFALYFDVKAPSANKAKGLGTGRFDLTVNNIFTKNIGDNVFDLNLGYVFVVSKGEDSPFFYCFDISRDLTEKIGICAEIYGENTFKGDFDDNILIGALSLSYEFNKNIYFEIGAGGGISKASPDCQFSSTISFNF